MSIGNYLISRYIRCNVKSFLTNGAGQLDFPAVPQRVWFGGYIDSAAGEGFIQTTTAFTSGVVGIYNLFADSRKIDFYMPLHGNLTLRRFLVVDGDGGLTTKTGIEGTLPQEVLRYTYHELLERVGR